MKKSFNVFLKNNSFVVRKECVPKKIFESLISQWNLNKRTEFCGNRNGRRWYSSKTPSNIIFSPLGEIAVPQIPFHELISQNWSLWEKKTAVICGATGRKYTYRKIMKNSDVLAASFQNKFQMKKGDFLALILPNCPEYPIVILACSKAGIIPTTVNPLYTSDEIKSQITICSPKAIVTDQTCFEKCADYRKSMNEQIPIMVLRTTKDAVLPEGGIDFFELLDDSTSGPLNPVSIEPSDALVLPFSSGTSGLSKGVLLTHRNLVSNLVQISHPETTIVNPTTKLHQDTILGVLPMFHIYGLVIVLFYFLKEGCRLITLPKFDPRVYVTNIAKKKVNILHVVPPIIKLLSDNRIPPKYLKSVKFVVNAAAPMVASFAYKIIEKAPQIHVAQGYGMTESSPALAHTSTKRVQKIMAIGIPVASTRFKIRCLETGEALPKGKKGELCAWGPQVMSGYFQRPEETKNAFDQDGWLRTGDIAYYDDDGDFFIVERLKSLIKVKGFQVAPAELEEVLLRNSKILEAAVIGVKHEEYGEVPRAYVVVKQGFEMTEEEVQNIIKQKMSSYKHLKGGVRFLPSLPKNNSGKIARKELEKLD